jgi:peptidoglycan/LPS O-acetylase OafA/YrhL
VLASIENLRPAWGRGTVAGLALLLSGVAAFIIYQAVEKPCAELRRRLQA